MIKRFFTITSLCIMTLSAFCQSPAMEIAKKHMKQEAPKWQFQSSDYKDAILSSEVTTDQGITYLYINQAIDGVPVRNAIMTMIIDKKGKVVSDQHSFVANAAKKASNAKPSLTADKAIIAAAAHLDVSLTTKPILVAGKGISGATKYALPELAKSSIPAKLSYELVNDKLILTWNLNIDMASNADYWDINIDANTGKFVSKNNFTLYCKHHKDDFAHHHDCEINTLQKMNDMQERVKMAIANRTNTTSSAAASYKVFKLPAESPLHANARSLASDDQFPLQSPFGWHDTNGVAGAEFTITRGNNVYAYQDKDDDDGSDGNDTDGGATLNFDFPMDFAKDPRESDDAALTNLFYMVNMMHDISAATGFTEEFGAFQDKNYTGKALDGEDDYVLAQAFDGIELYESNQDLDAQGNHTKINNANFATPGDGGNGRMQMFFWLNDGGAVSIDEPAGLAGFIGQYGTASFGRPIPLENETPIVGDVVQGKDGSGAPTLGCNTLLNAQEMAGKIVMIDRGICEFGAKALNAQKAGAIACIICNVAGISGGNGEDTPGMAAGAVGSQVTIPAISLKKSDCERIRTQLNNSVKVKMTWQVRGGSGAKFLDGALDNGVIAHEFGHGISNRLTGGRLAAGCLTNDEQMGEGWSDFFALVTSHEPGDTGTDARGIGTFASAQQKTGGGIRRFPYSTDMNINPETFDYIKGTGAPHPLGEVWATMLWDMYWAMIEKYGYNPDLTVKTSGNYKAISLVMEGMKIQKCNPGFIAGRDAIFKADEIFNNNENNCLLWEVFARRGLGINAQGGSDNDRNDGTQNFEPLGTCIEKLKITKTISPNVDPGGTVDITLTATNHIKTAISNVKIEDKLQAGMTFVSGSGSQAPTSINGNTVTFNLANLEYDKPLKITYKANVNNINKTIAYATEGFDKDINWEIEKLEGSEDWLPDYEIFKSPDVSMRIINVAADNDAVLVSTPFLVSGNNPGFKFYHRYDTEVSNDGGFVEISADGGPWRLIPSSKFVSNPYNNVIAYSTLAIPSLEGFSGTTGDKWIESLVDLNEFKGKTVKFRYRFVSDAMTTSPAQYNGWMVDDFSMVDFFVYETQACISADNVPAECAPATKTVVNSTLGSSSEDEIAFDVNVSPNPAIDIIYVNASAATNTAANVTLINTDGKEVYRSGFALRNNDTQVAVPVSGLPSGVYLVKVQAGSSVKTIKVIKL